MQEQTRIKNFPISFFSVVMGLAGFTIALQKAEEILSLPVLISSFFLWFTLIVWGIIVVFYFLKILTHFQDVHKEFQHPIRVSFFPTFSISLLLISIIFLHHSKEISFYFWIIGTVLHFLFTLKIISLWINHTKWDIKHLNPAWFIPAVGNIIVPVSGVSHSDIHLSWFFFSFGLFFWVILMVLFFNRVIFHPPLPDKLLPTLFILIAPPAVGLISYFKITNTINDFSFVLYYFALFLFLLLIFQFKVFKNIRYYLSWWAYSFPIAAFTIATILMFSKTKYLFFYGASYFLLVVLSILILLLLIRTSYAIFKKEICVEEE